MPRPTFEVRDLSHDNKVAEFFPNGHYECFKDEFKSNFERMIDIIEKAGQNAYDRFMAEYERMREQS